MEGFMPSGLGDGGAHLSEVVTLDDTPMGAASITTHMCLPECMSEGRQIVLRFDDGTLSAIKFPLLGKECDIPPLSNNG
jgi:hypothetical protein